MHLHDLLGDGEAQTGAAFGLSKGDIGLMELFEDTRLLGEWNARTGVCYEKVEVPVYRFRRDAHLAGVGELDGVADQVEQDLGEALLVAEGQLEATCPRTF